jgi:hypothetical protein
MPPAPPELARLALAAARAFRLGQETEGNQRLLALADAMGAMGAIGAAPPHEHGGPDLAAALAAAVHAQARGDWIGIADALEHELGPALMARSR